MTTSKVPPEGIPGLDDMFKRLGTLADAVHAREHAIDAELKALDKKEQDAYTAVMAVIQRIKDERRDLLEEDSQIGHILDAAKRAAEAKVPKPEPDRPATPAQPAARPPEQQAREPVVPPLVPPPADTPLVVTVEQPRPPVVAPPVVAQETTEQPAGQGASGVVLYRDAPPIEEVKRRKKRWCLNPRNWGWVQWLFAILGSIIGMVVGLTTYVGASMGNITGNWLGLYGFFYVVVWCLFMLFLFGGFGSLICKKSPS